MGKLQIVVLVGLIALSLAGEAFANSFLDDFNRPDGPAGNGWIDSAGNFGPAPSILSGSLHANSGSATSISRALPSQLPIHVQATLNPNANGRYAHWFGVSDSNTNQRGALLSVNRADSSNQGSAVVYNGGVIFSPFQFTGELSLDLTINPNGSMNGNVSREAQNFAFNVPSTTLGFTATSFQVGFDAIGGRIDDLRIAAPAPPPAQMYAILVGANDRGDRGDLDAQGIRSALLRFPGVKPENVSLAGTKTDFLNRMATVTAAIRPGDSLIVSYSGHGGYFLEGHSEPNVRNGPAAWFVTGDEFNNGDDAWAMPDGVVSDDELSMLLSSDPKLAQVKKTVFLDSCFSGGFWGQSGNEPDEGDFDKLQNIGLITSASEGGLSFTYPSVLPNAGRGFFSVALEGTLNDLADNDLDLDFSAIMLGLTTRYVNSNFSDSGAIRAFPWLGSETVITVDETLFQGVTASADYNMHDSLIPEPVNVALFLPAGSVLLHRYRRARKSGKNEGPERIRGNV